jgi:hypothetical protein
VNKKEVIFFSPALRFLSSFLHTLVLCDPSGTSGSSLPLSVSEVFKKAFLSVSVYLPSDSDVMSVAKWSTNSNDM